MEVPAYFQVRYQDAIRDVIIVILGRKFCLFFSIYSRIAAKDCTLVSDQILHNKFVKARTEGKMYRAIFNLSNNKNSSTTILTR